MTTEWFNRARRVIEAMRNHVGMTLAEREFLAEFCVCLLRFLEDQAPGEREEFCRALERNGAKEVSIPKLKQLIDDLDNAVDIK